MTALTPEQFMAQPVDPDEDTDALPAFDPSRVHVLPPDPLESIAESLRTMAGAIQQHQDAEQQDNELQARYDRLDEQYEQLARDFDAKQALIDRVLEICKPSVSKLANQIRDALAEPVMEPEAPVEGSAPGASDVAGAGDVATPPPAQPAHDAPVEEWREYARGRGYQGADVDSMNRSQIRTMLGIPHTDEAGA